MMHWLTCRNPQWEVLEDLALRGRPDGKPIGIRYILLCKKCGYIMKRDCK